MRVALCSPYDRTQTSGVSVFLNNLAGALGAEGVETRVIAFASSGSRVQPPSGLRNMTLAISTFVALVGGHGTWDAIHANQPHQQSVAALIASRVKGSLFVVTYHSQLPSARGVLRARLQQRLHRILLRRADRVVFVSQATRGELGRPTDTVIPNGVDFDMVDAIQADPREARAASVTFSFVGRQTRSKGFFDLLLAFQALVDSSPRGRARLLLIGETTPEEASQRSRLLTPLADLVEDRGTIHSRRDVLAHLARADAFVLPSYREGLPLALLEAMALGCVPIASPVGGIPEAVEDGVTGLLVPAGNVPALAETMRRLMDRPGDVARMSAAARDRVRAQFSLRRTVDAYLAVYAAQKPT